MERFQMYIGGEWCDAAAGEWFETQNPFTGKIVRLEPCADGPRPTVQLPTGQMDFFALTIDEVGKSAVVRLIFRPVP